MAQQALFQQHNSYSVYDLLDKKTSARQIREKLSEFATAWREARKAKGIKTRSGGITAAHDALIYPLLRLMCLNMAKMQKTAPKLHTNCIRRGLYVVKASRNRIIKEMLARAKGEKKLTYSVSVRTLNNLLARLVEAGFLSTKRAKFNPATGKRDNTLYYINAEWLAFFTPETQLEGERASDGQKEKNNFCPSINKIFTEQKKIEEKESGVFASQKQDVLASIDAKETVQSEGNCNVFFQKNTSYPQLAQQAIQILWKNCAARLDASQLQAVEQAITSQLAAVEQYVQAYRSQLVANFTQSDTFKRASEKAKLQTWICAKLPAVATTARAIVARAIAIQSAKCEFVPLPARYFSGGWFYKAIAAAQREFEHTQRCTQTPQHIAQQQLLTQLHGTIRSVDVAVRNGANPRNTIAAREKQLVAMLNSPEIRLVLTTQARQKAYQRFINQFQNYCHG